MGKLLVAALVALAAGFGAGYGVGDNHHPQQIRTTIVRTTPDPYSKFFK